MRNSDLKMFPTSMVVYLILSLFYFMSRFYFVPRAGVKPSFSCVCASLRLLLLWSRARSSSLTIVSSSAISPFPLKERAAFVVELAGGGLRLGRSSPRASRSSSGSNFSLRRRQQNAANGPKASGQKSGARRQERPRPGPPRARHTGPAPGVRVGVGQGWRRPAARASEPG